MSYVIRCHKDYNLKGNKDKLKLKFQKKQYDISINKKSII